MVIMNNEEKHSCIQRLETDRGVAPYTRMAWTCAPKGLQMLELIKAPQSSASLTSPPLFIQPSVPGRCFSFRLGRRSELFRFQGHTQAKVSCAASYDNGQEMSENNKDMARLNGVDHGELGKKGRKYTKSRIETDFAQQLMPSKLEYLGPNLLGYPAEQPEMNEMENINIEQKAKSFDIPLSLRIIKRKQKWQEGFVDAGDPIASSVRKAFSSVVFMMRELQHCAFEIRGSLYRRNLQGLMSKVQEELNSIFIWMFQQVFSRTPTLMVYVMIVLANFTVQSMAQRVVLAAIQTPVETISVNEVDQEPQMNNIDCSTFPVLNYPLEELSEQEMGLWKSVMEEAVKIEKESQFDAQDDHQITQQEMSPPVTVEGEPKDREQYYKTDMLYQMGIAEEPKNPLLLLNYARFLCLITKEFDRAEECYKRAVQVEHPDAEALIQYAYFLWKVRNDLWGAEEKYIQATSVEPSNTYYNSNYADFLWNTGGKETCYPLST